LPAGIAGPVLWSSFFPHPVGIFADRRFSQIIGSALSAPLAGTVLLLCARWKLAARGQFGLTFATGSKSGWDLCVSPQCPLRNARERFACSLPNLSTTSRSSALHPWRGSLT
jgi:hypothetical protein